MKQKQIYTPKYWMFHSLLSEDVYIETASKSLEESKKKASILYKKEYDHYENHDHTCFDFCLFEIKNIVVNKT
jgi:hypothetical protein